MQNDENELISSGDCMSSDGDQSIDDIAEKEPSTILSDIDARVLGCLMEKQQTTPDQYPLTQNSLVLACNQKSSREPKMSLTEGEVGHCLRDLEAKELIKVDMGARTYRYEHRMTMAFHVDKTLQAVLAVMLLRGPQTINELFTRTQRTSIFSNIDEVENALERLISRETPLVKLIPRQAGQREDRYAHLLSGEPEAFTNKASEVIKSNVENTDQSHSLKSTSSLEKRVIELEAQVLALQSAIEDLKIEGLTE